MAHVDLVPVRNRTLSAHVVDQLREAIVCGHIAPGTKLLEVELAQKLGVSRGPLREAIRVLVEQGLVTNVPYTGNFVTRITPEQLEEIYSFRTVLERFAFSLLWDKRTAAYHEELDRRHLELRTAIDKGDGALAIAAELRLHSFPYEFCGHGLLRESWNSLRGRLQVYFTLHQRAHDRPGPARDAHDRYVALAKGDDLDAMLEHIAEHMQQGLHTVIEFVRSQQPRSAAG